MSNPPELSPALGAWRGVEPPPKVSGLEEADRPPVFVRGSASSHRSKDRAVQDTEALSGREKHMAENANRLRTSNSPLVLNILRICLPEELELDPEIPQAGRADYTNIEWQLICSVTAARSGYDPKRLARLCAISLRQLERQFKKVFNATPRDWLNELRMTEACKLLTRSNSIKEVAYTLFYKQPSHFTREFKGRFGVTPSQYRDLDGAAARRSVADLYPELGLGKRCR